MELGRPLAVITPSVDGDVLRVLALAEQDFTPGAVHALIGQRSVDGVRKALDRLVDQGIVRRRAAGRAHLYGLNRDHLAAEPVIALARTRERLLSRLTEYVTVWREPVIYGAMFGSAARAEQRPDSDLDLFVVHQLEADIDVWSEQVAELSRLATAWTGNDARVLTYGAAELMSDLDEDGVVRSVADEGLHFAGDPAWLRRVLRRRRTARRAT